MRLAVISDIHGNLLALEAVLADIAARGIDRIVNLGDLLSGPLWPAETAERLMALDLPTIAGNHERQLLTQPIDRMSRTDAFTAPRLHETHRAWIAALPPTLHLDEVLLVHGTPCSDLDYFLETVEPGGVRRATLAEVESRAGSTEAALILCGHTHLQRQMRLGDGRLVVNPGSAGLQAYDSDQPFDHVIEAGSPQARYAIVERDPRGWEATFVQVDYDWEAAAAQAEANDAAPWWLPALATGRLG